MRWLPILFALCACYDVHGGDVSGQNLIARGLWVDPAGAAVPEGGMQEALDVVARRPGQLQPRPAFGEGLADADIGTPGDLIPFDGDVLIEHQGQWEWLSNAVGNNNIVDEDSSAITSSVFVDAQAWAAARGNLYMMANDGVRVLTSGGDTLAGLGFRLPPVIERTSMATSGATYLAPTTAVNYRATAEYKDANGVITVSAPSGAITVYNHHASNTYYVSVRTYCGHLFAGDVIRLYRSYAVTSTTATLGAPSDDLYQVMEYELTSSDISTGYFAYTDRIAEADLGAPLYTSPARETYAGANFPPPLSYTAAQYQRSVFYGNVREPESFAFTGTWGRASDNSASATGIGYRLATGDFAVGTNTILNVSDTTGLQVGMIVHAATYTGGTPTVVTNISGSTVTMSDNALASLATVSVAFYDTLRVDNSYYAMTLLENALLSAADEFGSAPCGLIVISSSRERAEGVDSSAALESTPIKRTILLIQDDRSVVAGGFDLYATHGDELEPALPLPDGTAETTGNRYLRNAIYWSKDGQPTHVPLGNYTLVGSGEHPIQRLHEGRNSLWVFKTDGLYRLSGSGARSGWRVDTFDTSIVLVGRRHSCVLDGDVFAWTTKGIVRISEAGVQPLSEGRIQTLIQAHQEALGVDSITATTSIYGGGCWSNPDTGEVFFVDGTSNHVYVYNTKRDVWTRWTFPADGRGDVSSGVWNPADGLMYMGHHNASTGSAVSVEDGTEGTDYTCKMKWTYHTDDPGVLSAFLEASPIWEDRTGLTVYGAVYDSSEDATTDSQVHTYSAGANPGAMRAFVPRDHAMGTRLGVEIQAGGSSSGAALAWRISGIRFTSQPLHTAVSR